MKKGIFGVAENITIADRIVNQLIRARYTTSEISFVVPDTKKKFTTTNSRGEVTLAPTNVIGGSLGALNGITALSFPSYGSFVVGGLLTTVLGGRAPTSSSNTLVTALIHFGASETEATKYETALKSGNILVYVTLTSDERAAEAYEILRQEGARNISSTRESVRNI